MDNNPLNQDLTNYILARNYKLLKKLGAGAFGEIYLGQNKSNKEEYAIKLERGDTKHPQIFFEAKLYAYLYQNELNDVGIPKIYGQGTDGQFNYMVMDLLGQSLEDLFTKLNRKFSLKTVLMIGDQMIQRIEFIHQKQFLHRDIKPDNFLMGYGKKAQQVYIVDFGLAKRYQTKEGHIAYKEGKSLTGTARYASINTHMGLEQSRRDDLESLGYVLLYFLRGQLPWQNMKASNQTEKYQKIMEKKIETTSEILCRGFPIEFTQYITYCKNLKFHDKPDYVFLRGLFKEAMKKVGIEMDYKYDWVQGVDYISPPPKEYVSSMQKITITNASKIVKTEEKKIIIQVNDPHRLPKLKEAQIQFDNQKRTQRTNHGSVEKLNRNQSLRQYNTQKSHYNQYHPLRPPHPKIVTIKELQRKS